MKKRLLIFTIVLLLLSVGVAASQSDKTYQFNRLGVDIILKTDGDIDILETHEYTYLNGTFTFGFRHIPTRQLNAITQVRVSEGSNPYQWASQPNTPNTFITNPNVDGEFEIRWFYPSTSNSTRTFTIAYTVQGGLRYDNVGDQLWWRAIFAKHYVAIASAKVTIHLPTSINANQLKISFEGVSANQQIVNAQTIVWSATNIPDGQELEVRVQFPHGIVAEQKTNGQPQTEQRSVSATLSDKFECLFGSLTLVILSMGLIFGAISILKKFVSPKDSSQRQSGRGGYWGDSGGWDSGGDSGGWGGGGGGDSGGGGGDGGVG